MSYMTLPEDMAEPRSCCFSQQSPVCGNILRARGQQTGPPKQELVSTLFIFHRGHAYPGFERLTARWPQSILRSLIERLNRFHEDRANHRTLSYMKEGFGSQMGQIANVPVNDLSILPHINPSEFEQIVLLWPDANGMGWFHIERQVFNRKNVGSPVYVFNGRKRFFELSLPLWRKYRWRRFLEKSFFLEMGVLVVFWMTAPVLTVWDIMFEPRRRHE